MCWGGGGGRELEVRKTDREKIEMIGMRDRVIN